MFLMKDKKLMIRQLELVLIDILMILLSGFLALLIRYELVFANIEETFLNSMLKYAPINTLVTLGLFWFFRLYQSLWRYASITELGNIVLACLSSALVQLVAMQVLGWAVPRSYFVLQPIFLILLTTAERYSYRFLRRWRNRSQGKAEHRVMIIGAGEAGQMLLRELQDTPHLHYRPVCIIDDDRRRWGRYIQNVKIVGGRDRIQRTARNMDIDVIMIALPSMSKRQRKEIVDLCRNTGCEVKILPGMAQLIRGEYYVGQLRPVELEDLLGRDTIPVDVKAIGDYVRGKRVLVTGGGGSIGSELCRQIASHSPEMLVIFDIYENNAYDIQQELIKRYPNLDLRVEIGSVRDEGRLNDIFRRFRPQLVYHAAAHKHVPLMEESPNEAVKKQRLWHSQNGRYGRQVPGGAVRPHLHGQGGEPHQPDGGHQAHLRDDHPDL